MLNVGVSRRFAIAVMGQDRPGIVASVAGALLDLQGNVEDVATSILRGHFAMMLMVAAPDDVDRAVIDTALAPLRAGDLAAEAAGADSPALSIDAWEVHGPLSNMEATHVLSVYGPDHTGIVHAVARTLSGLSVNICDMVCRLHEGSPPLYTLTVEVAVPEGLEPERVGEAVASAVGPLGLESTLHPIERTDL